MATPNPSQPQQQQQQHPPQNSTIPLLRSAHSDVRLVIYDSVEFFSYNRDVTSLNIFLGLHGKVDTSSRIHSRVALAGLYQNICGAEAYKDVNPFADTDKAFNWNKLLGRNFSSKKAQMPDNEGGSEGRNLILDYDDDESDDEEDGMLETMGPMQWENRLLELKKLKTQLLRKDANRFVMPLLPENTEEEEEPTTPIVNHKIEKKNAQINKTLADHHLFNSKFDDIYSLIETQSCLCFLRNLNPSNPNKSCLAFRRKVNQTFSEGEGNKFGNKLGNKFSIPLMDCLKAIHHETTEVESTPPSNDETMLSSPSVLADLFKKAPFELLDFQEKVSAYLLELEDLVLTKPAMITSGLYLNKEHGLENGGYEVDEANAAANAAAAVVRIKEEIIAEDMEVGVKEKGKEKEEKEEEEGSLGEGQGQDKTMNYEDEDEEDDETQEDDNAAQTQAVPQTIEGIMSDDDDDDVDETPDADVNAAVLPPVPKPDDKKVETKGDEKKQASDDDNDDDDDDETVGADDDETEDGSEILLPSKPVLKKDAVVVVKPGNLTSNTRKKSATQIAFDDSDVEDDDVEDEKKKEDEEDEEEDDEEEIEEPKDVAKAKTKAKPKPKVKADDDDDDDQDEELPPSKKKKAQNAPPNPPPAKKQAKKNPYYSVPTTRHKKMWTTEQENAIRAGVERFGFGKWEIIRSHYSEIFVGRTNVGIKDKWRNMNKVNGQRVNAKPAAR